jgi:amino acid adenylation domain-containing protein
VSILSHSFPIIAVCSDEADIPLNLYAFGNIARAALEVPHTILVPGSESPSSTAAVTTVATLTDSLALSMRKAQDVFQSLNSSVNTVFKSAGNSASSFLQLMESKSIADESLASACSQSAKSNVPAFIWCHGAANPSITSTVSLPWSLSLSVSVSADPSSLLRFQFRYPPLPIKVQGDPRRRCVPHTLYLWASVLQRLIQHVSPAAAPAPPISMPSSSIADRWTLGNAPLLTPPERDLLLDSFSGCIENTRGQCKLPSGQLLTDIWADTVKKYPQNTAVVSVTQNIRWTYAEMDAKSSQLAQWLQSRGVGAGNTVGFFLPRSAQMYVTLLAILKAGAAYVPIDPEYPADRCSFILTDAGAPVLLTMSSLPVFAPLKSIVARAPLEAYQADDEAVKHEKYVEPSGDVQGDAALTAAARQREARRILTPFEGEVLFLDDEDFQRTLAEFDPKVVVAPTQIDSTGARAKMSAAERCYIIYTSGSTGRPKGVAIEHRAACCLVEAERMLFGVRPNDVIYQGFSISFDASIEELWLAWASGGALFCATPDIIHAGPALSSILVKHGVTVVSTVPTLLSMLESEIPCMRILILGGEACQRDLILKWAKPGRRMVNTYGPTEATVIATYLDCHVDISLVTIGRPIPNYFCYIIDPNTQQICPVGVTGELCIGGVCLSRGYVGRDELTVKVFIPNDFKRDDSGDAAMHKFPDQFLRKLPPPVPMAQSASDKSKPVTAAIVPGAVSHLDPARLYRTGDLTRWTEDGNIEFLGRIDAQVKLRGFRVELSEIESVLMQCDGVVSAVCTVREVAGVQQLVAYVVAKGATANTKLPIKVWKKALRVRLPPYMVPSIFEQIDDIPTLPSGKADRKKLPPPRPAAESGGGEEEDEDDGPALSKDELAALSPKTPMEIKLAAVWRELFAKSRILLNDDFFELGGHSLLAARLMTVLRKEDWTSHAAMADVYQHPTVQSLAAFLTETAPAPVVRRSSSMGSKRAKSVVSVASTSSLLSPQSMKTPLLEGDELEEEGDHPEDAVLPVSPCKYWLTGLLQIPLILMYLMILSVQQLLPWRTYSFMYDRDYSMWQIVLASMFSVSLLYMVLMVLAVIAKWVLIGRFKPGKYPIWGSFYFRWWIVTRLIDLLPTTFMRGTVLITWFYRALGAKIGKHVHVSTYRLDGFDLVSIGDHTSLCIDCQLQPIRFLNGYMIVGSIEIGERCYIGAKSVIVGGLKRPTVVQDEAQV